MTELMYCSLGNARQPSTRKVAAAGKACCAWTNEPQMRQTPKCEYHSKARSDPAGYKSCHSGLDSVIDTWPGSLTIIW